jgi:hypothetical protein
VTLTGSAQVALARNPRGRGTNAVARASQPTGDPYTAAGNPVDLAPQAAPRRYMPQDDNYIYPADGSDSGARYPAPRSSSQVYGAQVYQPQQRQYYDQGYGQQGYYQQQPRQYYQPRGGYYYYQN